MASLGPCTSSRLETRGGVGDARAVIEREAIKRAGARALGESFKKAVRRPFHRDDCGVFQHEVDPLLTWRPQPEADAPALA